MISNEIPDQEMERKLKVYFEAESARLRAPAGLWERIESMLEEHPDLEGNTPAWQRIFSPRRWGLVPAFGTTIVLLLAVSGAWLFTAAPWQDGGGAATPSTTERSSPVRSPIPVPGSPQPHQSPRAPAVALAIADNLFLLR